jgi:hypothetical protein
MTILNFISNGTTPARRNGNLVKVSLAISPQAVPLRQWQSKIKLKTNKQMDAQGKESLKTQFGTISPPP